MTGARRTLVGSLVALAASACATPGDAPGSSSVDRRDLPPFPRDEYPPGPYGVELLARIADYALEGRDGPVTPSQLRQDPRAAVLWIVAGAPWCPSCRAEAPTIAEIADAHEPEGLRTLPVVVSDLEGRRPGPADVDLVYPDLPTAVFDPWEAPSLTFDLAPDLTIVLPHSLIVDLASMRIVAVLSGWDEDEVRAELGRQL